QTSFMLASQSLVLVQPRAQTPTIWKMLATQLSMPLHLCMASQGAPSSPGPAGPTPPSVLVAPLPLAPAPALLLLLPALPAAVAPPSLLPLSFLLPPQAAVAIKKHTPSTRWFRSKVMVQPSAPPSRCSKNAGFQD